VGIKLFLLGVITCFVTSCTQGHCRRKADAPGEAKSVDGVSGKAGQPLANERVYVYKYDGSLQCGMGKPVAPEVMAKQLAGVPVHSSTKKPDGLMHIQVCGSITGMANVYEIDTKFLKTAEKKGFKKWSFE
jgi:hypothetical protein